ncbi:sugar ABC transporter permease, partial [Anaerotignum faecicola]|nr:sugar ABC transporter permease [Anaerotignum faecicola]
MKRKRLRYAKWGYIFCAPFVLGFLIFSLYPIIFTGVIGFTDFKGMGAVDFNFLEDPFQNFKTVLTNPSFKKAFGNNIHIWLFNFVPQIGLAL